MKNLLSAIHELSKVQATRFASLTYRNKQGELSRYTVLLGASYERAKAQDLARLLCLQPRLLGVAKIACNELIESYKKPAGANPGYTCQGVYRATSIKGVKEHIENGGLYLQGFVVNKTVLEPVEYPKVNSALKTIEKDKLRKLGRLSKIRDFLLTSEQINEIKLNGKTLVIN